MNREIYEGRLKRLQSHLAGVGADAMLIVCQDGRDWENIYYLTGFWGSCGVLLVSQREGVLFVDPRYAEEARSQASCSVVCCSDVQSRSPLDASIAFLRDLNPFVVGCEARNLSHFLYRYVDEGVDEPTKLMDLSGVLSAMRRKKTPSEVELLKEASEIAAVAFLELLPDVDAGRSERDIAIRLEFLLRSHGGDMIGSAGVMVSSGERTASPHAYPTTRSLRKGDLVMIDFGARYAGYLCDITRMISIGGPSDGVKDAYSIVAWAATEAASRIKPGISAQEVDEAARSVLRNAGLEAFFPHGTGHGIGLSIHESPAINTSSGQKLAEGDVVTVEPGFYRPGWGGIRIEDDYLVTDSGALCLTEGLGRDLFVV